MTREQGTVPRLNITIPLKEGSAIKVKEAFKIMAAELGAESPGDLGRQIIGEVMQCHFGLQRAKELGIISAIATSVPPPMYVQYASSRFDAFPVRKLAV